MWENKKFEHRMHTALVSECGQSEGEKAYGQYTTARATLLEQVLNEIRGAEPFLTDHGPDHIANVLDNVDRLLGDDTSHFNARELYLMGLSILLHDVGNLEGRREHNQRIGKYYDLARPGSRQQNAPEKRLVIAAAKAHTGTNRLGGKDTLQDVPETEYLHGDPIRVREISAIVRFADELAEGPQRTSFFLQAEKQYPPDAAIHHKYASVTHVAIDRNLRRISLCYIVHVDGQLLQKEEELHDLHDLLIYINKRVIKLDEERKYARFYCPELLVPFRETRVQIEIGDGDELDYRLDPLILSDKVVPEGKSPDLQTLSDAYAPDNIMRELKSKLSATNRPDDNSRTVDTGECNGPQPKSSADGTI